MKTYSALAPQLQVENSANALETVIEFVESSFASGSYPANLAEHQEPYAEIARAQREAASRTAAPPVRRAAEVIPVLIAEAAAIAESVKAGAPLALATESFAVYRSEGSIDISQAEAADARFKAARARGAWSAKAARLLVKTRAAIKGAFIACSRAVRQPRRSRRPATKSAGSKASAGDGGDGGDGGRSADNPPRHPVQSPIGHGPRCGALRKWSFRPDWSGEWNRRVVAVLA